MLELVRSSCTDSMPKLTRAWTRPTLQEAESLECVDNVTYGTGIIAAGRADSRFGAGSHCMPDQPSMLARQARELASDGVSLCFKPATPPSTCMPMNVGLTILKASKMPSLSHQF